MLGGVEVHGSFGSKMGVFPLILSGEFQHLYFLNSYRTLNSVF